MKTEITNDGTTWTVTVWSDNGDMVAQKQFDNQEEAEQSRRDLEEMWKVGGGSLPPDQR